MGSGLNLNILLRIFSYDYLSLTNRYTIDDMNATPSLPATAYAVLGLLTFGHDLSGYELRGWAQGSFRHFYWSPAQSQIYRELKKLEEVGFVESSAVPQADRPDKTAYTITEIGRRALSHWVASKPVDRPVLKHHPAMRLFFGHLVEPSLLIEILEEHVSSLMQTLDDLEMQSAALTGDETSGFSPLVFDWAAEIHRGDLRGAEMVIKHLTTRG